jgi:hypothetical protein
VNRPPRIQRSVVLRGHGHPAIRATHAKTFELMAGADISERATCVVAVGTGFDRKTVEELALLRGPVRLVLSTPGLPSFLGEAVINPGHAIRDRIVIRRREAADGEPDVDTLATDATLTAKDLSPEFAAALSDPEREVALLIEEVGIRRPLVLVGTTPRGETVRLAGRDRALWFAADDFIDYSGSAPILPPGKLAKLAADALGVLSEGGAVAIALPALDTPPPAPAADFLTRAARLGARFATLPHGGAARTAAEALLAAGLPPAPHAWLGSPQRLAALPAMPTVFRMPAAASPVVLDNREVWLEDTGDRDLGVAVHQVTADEAVAAVGALTVVGPAEDTADAVDVAAVARALADAGIAPRTLSEALAPFGLTRKRLYALLQDQAQGQEPDPGKTTGGPVH